jgi:transposase
MALHCGVDLHGSNAYYGIVDESGRRVFARRVPNRLEEVLRALEPYRRELAVVVVESTYNWYWLVDGLSDHGYNARLAHPPALEQYSGMKHTDDRSDSFFLAELSRLGILPEGHIYPREGRAVRDLLRRRLMLVQQRTAHVLSFQSFVARERGEQLENSWIQRMRPEDVELYFDDPRLVLIGQTNIEMIGFLSGQIARIEKAVLAEAKLKGEYAKLLTVPGIGKVLALTIMLETGDVGRFSKAGNYVSYCRCARSARESNGRKKGQNNRKNGNRYLSWAYVEAAHFMRRHSPAARRWYQRKVSRSKRVVAVKALAGKIARACYYVMRDQVDFDEKMLFG